MDCQGPFKEENIDKSHMRKIIDDFDEVFSESLGKNKGCQVKIHVTENATLKHCVTQSSISNEE